jgi:hypothetical protein
MRGHHAVIDLRRVHRRTPGFVFIDDFPTEPGLRAAPSDLAVICTDGDDIALLDLRFLIGLRVMVHSHSEARARALFERCQRAGVAFVGACHLHAQPHPNNPPTWDAVWHKEAVSG